MTTEYLLDTCAAIWAVEDMGLSPAASEILADISGEGSAIWVSPITAWEIGLLVSRNRMNITVSPDVWFAMLLGRQRMSLGQITPDILIDSSFLPGGFNSDPADRIIVAMARNLGPTVITRDRKILDYAAAGHVNALAC